MKIIDVHCHSGAFPKIDPHLYDFVGETMPDFIADLDKDNIEYCFISSTNALYYKDVHVGNWTTLEHSKEDKRILPYVYFNPLASVQSVQDANHFITEKCFYGFKSRPSFHACSIWQENYRPMIEMAAYHSLPILLHSFHISDAEAVVKLCKSTSQKPTIILAHACNDIYELACKMIKPYENLYIEPITSAVYPGKVRKIIDIIGHERLLFGSDYGLLKREKGLQPFLEANLTDTEKYCVFRGNAIRIFNLREKGCL